MKIQAWIASLVLMNLTSAFATDGSPVSDKSGHEISKTLSRYWPEMAKPARPDSAKTRIDTHMMVAGGRGGLGGEV